MDENICECYLLKLNTGRINCQPRKMLMIYNWANCSYPNYLYTLVCKLIWIRVSMIKKDIQRNHILIGHAWSDNYVIFICICWLINYQSISPALYTTKKPTNHSLFIFRLECEYHDFKIGALVPVKLRRRFPMSLFLT